MSAVPSDILLERMMSLHPKIIDLTLDRMHRILAALDHPERRVPPVIHIAGTNGKRSTLAMIAACGMIEEADIGPIAARIRYVAQADAPTPTPPRISRASTNASASPVT